MSKDKNDIEKAVDSEKMLNEYVKKERKALDQRHKARAQERGDEAGVLEQVLCCCGTCKWWYWAIVVAVCVIIVLVVVLELL